MQADAAGHLPPPDSPADWTRFWRVAEAYGAEFLHATFTNHTYDRHVHDRYVFGVTTGGAEQFWQRGQVHYAPMGKVVVLNPGDVHDGGPGTPGEQWKRRICYLDPALFTAVAADLTGRADPPLFLSSVLDDPGLATALNALHAQTEQGALSALERDTRLRGLVALLIRRHATHRPDAPAPGREPAAVRQVRAFLDGHYAEDVSLADLGALVGLSPLYLARTFRAVVGVPPHAYQILKRVEAAGALLRSGTPLAEAAALCGFSDQSHMTRQFRRAHGVTPGLFRRAAPPACQDRSRPPGPLPLS